MLLSQEDSEKVSAMHAAVAEYLEKNPRPPPSNEDPVPGIRAALKMLSGAIVAKLGPAPDGFSEKYHQIPMRDGCMSQIKIHRPVNGGGALIVLAYGGGFVAGDNDQFSEISRALVKAFGATVVNINYRHAPEDKFPMSQYDAWDSVKWIADNATGSLLAADPSKGFIMGGASAGACLTSVLSRKFQEEKLSHPLTGQWLCAALTRSREQNADNPFLSKDSLDHIRKVTAWDTQSDLCSPMQSKTPASGQPKTFFTVEGLDSLRDDSLVYDEILKEAGVQTKVDLYPGCPHVHMFVLMGQDLANKALVDIVVGFGWLLDRSISREDAAAALGM